MKSVFITRDLADKSLFKKILKDEGFAVFHSSLIQFSPTPFQYISKPDWIFFYSKNGVYYFLKKKSKENFGKVKFGTIGVGTAEYLNEFGIEADFVGNGDPSYTAEAFLRFAKNKVVLFPRAEQSKKSIQKLLKGKIKEIDLVVYRNEPKTDIHLPDTNVVIFTSPLNAEIYLQGKENTDFQSFIAIGNTTAKALRELEISAFIISKSPAEKDLAEAVLLLFQK